jgi:hypothetical protein
MSFKSNVRSRVYTTYVVLLTLKRVLWLLSIPYLGSPALALFEVDLDMHSVVWCGWLPVKPIKITDKYICKFKVSGWYD